MILSQYNYMNEISKTSFKQLIQNFAHKFKLKTNFEIQYGTYF